MTKGIHGVVAQRLEYGWRYMALALAALLLAACGGSQVGSQDDQAPPVASAKALGLPTTSAAAYTVRANTSVTLTGKDSRGPHAPVVSFQWQQIAGDTLSLSQPTEDAVVLVAPNVAQATEYQFQLTVVDANGRSDSATLALTVLPIDDVNQFLSSPAAPDPRLRVVAALRGGDSTGTSAQPFTLTATTTAHWINTLGQTDSIVVHSQSVNAAFPANFSPALDYAPLDALKNPRLLFETKTLNINDINSQLTRAESGRRLEPQNLATAYLEVQLSVQGTPSVDFELFAVNAAGVLISGVDILAPETSLSPARSFVAGGLLPLTAATNGALLQTWNGEFSAAILSDRLAQALGLASQASANNYYQLIDPGAQFYRLASWLAYAGFDADHTQPPADPAVANALFFNNYDLGLGRNVHMREDANGNIFAFSTNFPSLENALACRLDASVFAMELSDNPDPNGDPQKIVKFYAFLPDPKSGDYIRTASVDLDGRGQRMVPDVCVACHQGTALGRDFSDVSQADLGAAFLPFDLDGYLFAQASDSRLVEPTLNAANFTAQQLSKNSREAQADEFRALNSLVLKSYSANPSRHAAAAALVRGWYGAAASATELAVGTFNGNYVQPGWSAQADLYQSVVMRHCRNCHVQIDDGALDFDAYDEFSQNANLATRVFGEGSMPSSRLTMDRFWIPFIAGQTSAAEILRAHLAVSGAVIPEAPGAPLPKILLSTAGTGAGQTVLLNGTESQFAESYNWSLTRPAGSQAALTNASGPISGFTVDVTDESYLVSLVVTNKKGAVAQVDQLFSAIDLVPEAACFNADTSAMTASGLLAVIPVMDFISVPGDGGLRISTALDGSLGSVQIAADGQSLSYQLANPFARGVDTLAYQLQDANGSLSISAAACGAAAPAGFGVISVDSTSAGTFAPGNPVAVVNPVENATAIDVSWQAPSALVPDGYNIYRSATAAGAPLNGSVLLTQTTFTDTNLLPDTTYDYAVEAVSGSFASNPATVAATTLSITPLSVTATALSSSHIALTWAAPAGNVSSYRIYRDGQSVPIVELPASDLGYDDFGVTSGASYSYTMTGVSGSAESVQTAPVTASTSPSRPVNLNAVQDSNGILLSWSAVNCSGGISYRVDMVDDNSGMQSTQVVSAQSAQFVGLAPGSNYTFTVTANCNGLSSAPSNPLSVFYSAGG